MSKTLVVCSKCGKTAEYYDAKASGWLVQRREDSKASAGQLVIRCPEHITAYALRQAGSHARLVG